MIEILHNYARIVAGGDSIQDHLVNGKYPSLYNYWIRLLGMIKLWT